MSLPAFCMIIWEKDMKTKHRSIKEPKQKSQFRVFQTFDPISKIRLHIYTLELGSIMRTPGYEPNFCVFPSSVHLFVTLSPPEPLGRIQ